MQVTKIGVVVNTVRKHLKSGPTPMPASQVNGTFARALDVATSLVEEWKLLVRAARPQ
jgi:hypothetical protein